jgi:hypothetical protein
MFLDLPDLDLQVRGMDPDPDPPIVMQNSKKKRNLENFSVADPGSGIGCLFDSCIRIRDRRKSASGSGIRDERPGSYFLKLSNHFYCFFGVKILKFLDEDPDHGDSSDPGSGMEKSRIRNPG